MTDTRIEWIWLAALAACATDPGDEVVTEYAIECDDDEDEDPEVFPGPTESIAVCNPNSGAFTTNVTNPYFPLRICNRRVLRSTEDGVVEEVQITVLDETRIVAGVETRVVEEYETEDGELVEISYNYFAQARDRTVCYFGEHVDIFEEDGTITHEGAWLAGVDEALPGIIMPGKVREGQAYLQEVAPGIAEDRAWHTELEHGRLFVTEDTPLEPGALSHKIYRKGKGLVRDGTARLISNEDLDPEDCVRSTP